MTTKNGNGQTSAANRRAFIAEYPKYGSVGETIKSIGVKNRRTFYDWCTKHPDFKKIYEAADSAQTWEQFASEVGIKE